MTRHEYKTRTNTNDFPFYADLGAALTLPGRIGSGKLLSASAHDEHPTQYHRFLHLTTSDEMSVLQVAFVPPKSAISRAERTLGRCDAADYLGYVRYVWAPYDLVHFATALPPGGTRYTRPFTPDGPFEFIPPEHGYDYTTRARLKLSTRLETVSAGADLLLRLLLQARIRRVEPLAFRFMYETARRAPRL
jgi:hypothetical protein